jgi:ligand-binding sensor domain-containing protein
MPKTILSAAFSSLVLSVAVPTMPSAAQVTSLNPAPADVGNASRAAGGEVVSEISKNVFIVFQGRKGTYWFGSDGDGVYRYDGKTIVHFTMKDGLSHGRVRDIQEDKSGNILVATLNGIDRFDGQKFVNLTAEDSNAPDGGWRLEPDDLWFSSLYGKPGHNGPYRYDGKTLFRLKLPKHHLEDEFTARNPNPVSSPYEVYDIYRDRRGHIWIGTLIFGACRYDGQSWGWLHEKHLTEVEGGGTFGVRSILEDKEGSFWFCNTRYRFKVSPKVRGDGQIDYKRATGIDFRTPAGGDMIYFMSAIEDDRGNLWMATYDEGVWRYDGETMTRFPVKDGDKDVRLFSMTQDNHGTLWLGTPKSGAYRFNGKTFEKLRP